MQNYSVIEVEGAFGHGFIDKLMPYRDAGIGLNDFPITLKHCLFGL